MTIRSANVIRLRPEAQQLTRDSLMRIVSPQQLAIVDALSQTRVVASRTLADVIYSADPCGGPDDAVRAMHVQVCKLNRRVREVTGEPLVESVRTHGYRLTRSVS